MRQERVRYQNLVMDSSRWNGLDLRDGDIVISTPPKCGTTWTQMICALLIFQSPDLPDDLGTLSVWPDVLTRRHEDMLVTVDAQRHRRFFKTHTPPDGLPFDERVTYICVGRDPRDVAISCDHHFQNIDIGVLMELRKAAVGPDTQPSFGEESNFFSKRSPSARDRFWAWVDNPDVMIGLPATFHHLSEFWAVRELPNIVLLHYRDLERDLAGQMRSLAGRLGIDVPRGRWPELVRAAGFDVMRARADRYAPEVAIWRDPRRFFFRGASGQWRDLLDADDMRRYAARVGEIAEPDVTWWAHQGAINV